MSLKALTWVMEQAPVDDPTSLLVLYALADRAHDDGTAAWPSQDWIAERARCSDRTVRRVLGKLEEQGVIRKGDPRHVAHIREDRRPTVWNLQMGLSRADTHVRADKMTGRTPVTERPDTGDQTGGHPWSNDRTQLCPTNRPEPSMNHPEPKEGGTSGPRQGRRLPEGWSPPPHVWDDVSQKCPNVNLEDEHENFMDYWLSKTGKDATKLDWSRTWRSWMRRSEKWSKQKGGRAPSVDEVLSWNVAHSMNEKKEVPF